MIAKNLVLVPLQENKAYLTKTYGLKEPKCDNFQFD
jgi:hypothetical protein